MQRQFHSDVAVYVRCMTFIMKEWMTGKWHLAIRLMDNTTKRTLTPYLVIGVCSGLAFLPEHWQ